jgi:hypothetical protein
MVRGEIAPSHECGADRPASAHARPTVPHGVTAAVSAASQRTGNGRWAASRHTTAMSVPRVWRSRGRAPRRHGQQRIRMKKKETVEARVARVLACWIRGEAAPDAIEEEAIRMDLSDARLILLGQEVSFSSLTLDLMRELGAQDREELRQEINKVVTRARSRGLSIDEVKTELDATSTNLGRGTKETP